jgi:hypothetical protein
MNGENKTRIKDYYPDNFRITALPSLPKKRPYVSNVEVISKMRANRKQSQRNRQIAENDLNSMMIELP